jgi:hypothetical protein
MKFTSIGRLFALAGLFAIRGVLYAAAPTVTSGGWPIQINITRIGAVYQPIVVGYAFRSVIQAFSTLPITAYDATGLPTGLQVDHATGVISGTPQAAGDFNVTLFATNADGTGSTNATLTVNPAPTAAPVVSPMQNVDVAYSGLPGPGYDSTYRIIIAATNFAQEYRLTNLDTGQSSILIGGVLELDKSNITVASGTSHMRASATNPIGTGSTDFLWTVHPTVRNIDLVGEYYPGDIITVHAKFDGTVVVTGQPSIGFGHTGTAAYVSGSGTDTLTFSGVVTPADVSTTRYLTPFTIQLNGGTINHPTGPTAMLTIPSDQLTPSTTYQIHDNTRITGVVTPTARTYAAGDVLDFTINFTNAVTAVGTPTLPLTIGTTPRSATYVSGSGSSSLVFRYVVAADDLGAVAVRSPLVATYPNGIRTSADLTVPLSLVLAPPDTSGVIVAAPSIPTPTPPSPLAMQSVTINPIGNIAVDQSVTLSATASSGLPVTFSLISGDATLVGNTLRVNRAGPVVIRATQAGNGSFSPAAADVTLIAGAASQTLDFASPVSSIIIGKPVALGAISSAGLPITYTVVSGPATVSGNLLTVTGSGPVVVRATQAGNDTVGSASAEITVTGTGAPLSRLVNLSSRARVIDGDVNRTFIAGFVVSGSGSKRILLRAVGPSLAAFGVQDALTNPRLELFDTTGKLIAQNDDWTGTDVSAAFSQLGAFSLNNGSRDAALLVTLPPGGYSFHVQGNGGSGIALAEVYDADASTSTSAPLINISSRAYVDSGEGVLVAGFVVTGDSPKRLLVRGVGPGLTGFGVGGVVADPVVKVYQNGVVVAQNDNWETGQPIGSATAASAADLSGAATKVGAFALTSGSKDAALLVTLPSGNYSAVVSGVNGTSGAGLVEVYEVP